MDYDLYGKVVCEVERILCGITQKMENITREEWLNNYWGGVSASKNEEDIISFNKMIWCHELRMQSEHQLEFVNIEDARKKIDRAFSYVIGCKLPFEILELVFYALVSMIYFSMRKRNVKDIEEVDSQIKEFIAKLTEKEEEKDYLKVLNSMLFLDMVCLYIAINSSGNECDLDDENKYKEEYEKLLDSARQIFPDGEIVELMNEIFVVEDFFKNPTNENIDRVKRLCFDKKENWMGHICICSSPQMDSVVQPWMHYLPHVSFCNSFGQ